MRVEPVKPIASTSGCSASASPASLPKPETTFSTPGGSPASSASSPSRAAVNGERSDGFNTTELPVASAGPSFQAVMIIG